MSCRHLREALHLAVQQRLAHEYDDTEAEEHWCARPTALGTASSFTAKRNEFPEMQAAGKSFVPSRGRNRVNDSTFVQPSAESRVQDGLQPAGGVVDGGGAQAETPPVTTHQDQALQRWFARPQSQPHCLIKSRPFRSHDADLKAPKVS